jgi:hypothetical protein
MKMIVEKQMECRLAGETEVLGENLPQRHFSETITCREVYEGELPDSLPVVTSQTLHYSRVNEKSNALFSRKHLHFLYKNVGSRKKSDLESAESEMAS